MTDRRAGRSPTGALDVEAALGFTRGVATLAAGRDPATRAAVAAQAQTGLSWLLAVAHHAAVLETAEPEEVPALLARAETGPERLVARAYRRSRGLPEAASAGSTPRGMMSSLARAQGLLGPAGAVLRQRGPRARGGLALAALQPNSTRALLSALPGLRARGLEPTFLLLASDGASTRLVAEAGAESFVVESMVRPSDLVRGAVALTRAAGGEAAALGALVRLARLPDWLSQAETSAALAARLAPRLALALIEARAVRRSLRLLHPRALVAASDHPLVCAVAENAGLGERAALYLQGVIPDVPAYAPALTLGTAFVGSALDLPYLRQMVLASPARTVGYPSSGARSTAEKDAARTRLRALLPGGADGPLVVFTSQYPTELFPDWARRANLDLVLEAARLLPGVRFLIKAHPRREQLDAALLARLPPTAAVTDAEAPLLLAGSDAVVTYWSTTALEALLYGTPLVQLNGTGLPDYFPVVERMGRETARTAQELARALRPLLHSEEQRRAQLEAQAALLAELGVRAGGEDALAAAIADWAGPLLA